jgi:hypothetical protein
MCEELSSNDVTAQSAKLEATETRNMELANQNHRAPCSSSFEYAGSTDQGGGLAPHERTQLHFTKRHAVGAWILETTVES